MILELLGSSTQDQTNWNANWSIKLQGHFLVLRKNEKKKMSFTSWHISTNVSPTGSIEKWGHWRQAAWDSVSALLLKRGGLLNSLALAQRLVWSNMYVQRKMQTTPLLKLVGEKKEQASKQIFPFPDKAFISEFQKKKKPKLARLHTTNLKFS